MPQTKGAYLNWNGKYIPKDDFSLSLEHRGFLYADGFFETIFCTGTRTPFLKYHYLRIEAAYKMYRFSMASLPSYEDLQQQISGLLTRNKYFAGARVRVVFSRKEGGLYTPISNNTDILMTARELEHDNFRLNTNGLIVDISANEHVLKDKFSLFKNIHAQTYVQAGIEKAEHQLDDILLLNDKGYLAEALSSNLFVVKDGMVYTPHMNSGCVGGVIRQFLIDNQKAIGIKIKQDQLNPAILLHADEVFITNAIQGIRWIGAFRDKRYYYALSKKLMAYLNKVLVNNTY